MLNFDDSFIYLLIYIDVFGHEKHVCCVAYNCGGTTVPEQCSHSLIHEQWQCSEVTLNTSQLCLTVGQGGAAAFIDYWT